MNSLIHLILIMHIIIVFEFMIFSCQLAFVKKTFNAFFILFFFYFQFLLVFFVLI